MQNSPESCQPALSSVVALDPEGWGHIAIMVPPAVLAIPGQTATLLAHFGATLGSAGQHLEDVSQERASERR